MTEELPWQAASLGWTLLTGHSLQLGALWNRWGNVRGHLHAPDGCRQFTPLQAPATPKPAELHKCHGPHVAIALEEGNHAGEKFFPEPSVEL